MKLLKTIVGWCVIIAILFTCALTITDELQKATYTLVWAAIMLLVYYHHFEEG